MVRVKEPHSPSRRRHSLDRLILTLGERVRCTPRNRRVAGSIGGCLGLDATFGSLLR